MKKWVSESINKISAEYQRSADTHMIKLGIPALQNNGIDIYLKDESTHPTGSLKHRLARSLFMYALCNGKICSDTTIIEASSGSTAVSEAYFAQMIGIPFIAVMPRNTAKCKIQLIELYGGQCHFVDCPTQMIEANQQGSLVTLLCDSGERYLDTYYDPSWVKENIGDLQTYSKQLEIWT